MLPDKITKNFKEISKFFVENFDNSANAIFTVLDMLNLNDKSLCLPTNYNAKYSQSIKFILILLMPFFCSLMKMLKRSFRHGFKAKYVLADSWFCSIELIRFVTKTLKINFLGMAKHGNTKYDYKDKQLTINELIAKRKDTKTSKQYNCKYIRRDVVFKETPVTLFCIRLTKKGKWRTIITTDADLNFESAMEIYAMRWSIEVFFKECKQHLLPNNCQSVDFDVQIAEITFSFIRFNILSTILRKQKYDTMGGLFEEITKDTLELTINERIILFIRDLVENIKKQLSNCKNTLLVDSIIENQLVNNLTKLE